MEISEKLGSVESLLGQVGLGEWEAGKVLDLAEFFLAEASVLKSLREKEEIAFNDTDPEEEAVRVFLKEAADTGRLVRTDTGRKRIYEMVQPISHAAIRLSYPDIHAIVLAPFEGAARR